MITLPPMPRLKDFPGHEYGFNSMLYQTALDAWKCICKKIIENTKKGV